MSNLEALFNAFQEEFAKDAETRDSLYAIVKKLDAAGRQILQHSQIIHTTADKTAISDAIIKCKTILESAVQPLYANLEETLSPICTPPFYQYHDLWRHATQRLTFLASLLVFLESGKLALFEDVAMMLKMKSGSEKGLSLDLDDYLAGLLTLASELSRLAVNSVTHGDYNRPLEISKFVGDLAAGFRLLTFKNDFLRKRYDALKYDVKKIEEVVYDLSIRGISAPATS